MKVTKIPVETQRYIFEFTPEEATVLKVLCGMMSGSTKESYARVTSQIYKALSDLNCPEYNFIRDKIVLIPRNSQPGATDNRIHWCEGLISDSELS